MFGFFATEADRKQYLYEKIGRYYPEYQPVWKLYRQQLAPVVDAGMLIVDAGCGRKGLLPLLLETEGEIVGVDLLREDLLANGRLTHRIQADLATVPLSENSVDLISSEFVLEHLSEPEAVCREFSRLLRPGGRLIFLTPNRYHPIMLMSRFTPYKLHRWAYRVLLRRDEMPHPVCYLANDPQAFARLAAAAGLHPISQIQAGNPEYLSFWRPLVVPAVLWERLVAWLGIGWLQLYWVCVWEKRAG